MRMLAFFCAVAALVVTALPFQANAYCRGCVVSPKAAAAGAAAETIGRSVIIEEGSRAYAAEPMPDSPLPRYSRPGDEGNGAVCRVETRTETLSDGTEHQRRIENCE